MKNNLELWNKVEKTNPNYTKKANVKGNKITSIAPQYQVMNATEQFGIYGETWGFKKIELDYGLASIPFKKDKTEGAYPNVKVVGKEDSFMGLVTFKGTFFFPNGEFEIINSISLFTNNEMSKIDSDFAKKLETDTLTKALSKLGFNADIFLGKFDDTKYFNEINQEFNPPVKIAPKGNANTIASVNDALGLINACTTLDKLKAVYLGLDKDIKANPDVIAKKEDQKLLLTPTK